jgi:hypothetical protein
MVLFKHGLTLHEAWLRVSLVFDQSQRAQDSIIVVRVILHVMLRMTFC